MRSARVLMHGVPAGRLTEGEGGYAFAYHPVSYTHLTLPTNREV